MLCADQEKDFARHGEDMQDLTERQTAELQEIGKVL